MQRQRRVLFSPAMTVPEQPAVEDGSTGMPTHAGRPLDGLAADLLPLFYEDLKHLARRERRRGESGHTLQTTALVHEAFLRLRSARGWNDQQHFLRSAALAMRHALIQHATRRLSLKRGQGAVHLPLTEGLQIALDEDETLLALDEALARLAVESERLAQVVECRFFAGYDEAETATALGISSRTVRRDWTLARAWLHRELGAPAATIGG
jgi:RNA polymerase sigma factor (TIGR02999 family)